MKYLVISVQFLGDRYHGRTANGREPEWPPSPLRLFQAIVAGAASRWHDHTIRNCETRALEWFEGLEPPHIEGPLSHPGKPLLKYVPENLFDVAPEKRGAKFSRPTLFAGEPVVVYYWNDIKSADEENAEIIVECSRHCRALGWGIDMVISNGKVTDVEPCSSTAEKWLPTTNVENGVFLRVPQHDNSSIHRCTLKNLQDRFSDSLNRIDPNGRNPVKPLTAFRVIGYRRATDPASLPFATFSLLTPDAEAYRPFDPVRGGMKVAAMMRHAAGQKPLAAALGWTEEKLQQLVLGHGEEPGESHQPVEGARVAFLPLPSLESRGGKGRVVGSIRRVLVAGLARYQKSSDKAPGKVIVCPAEVLQQLARSLSGQNLIDEKKPTESAALLSRIPNSEKMVRQYTEAATTWATVTPVVLPGYDDPRQYRRRLFAKEDQGESQLKSEEQERLLGKLDARTELLLRKTIRQAGYSDELAQNAVLDWRDSGFWPGTDLASRYAVPEKLRRFRRLHVRITWTDDRGNLLAVPGPLCLGSGRFIGLGLFAPMPSV